MGVINYQPSIEDEYSAEVIRLARDRSPNVANWIAEQRYLLETEEENLNPEWMRNRCCVKIVTEDFDLMGINLNMEVDEALDHADLVYGILMLRSKFDPDNLSNTLKRNPELINAIESMDPSEDKLGFIVDWCSKNMPLDDGWEMLSTRLSERVGIFESNSKFNELLSDLIERIRNLGEPDITSDVDPEMLLKMLQFLQKRTEKIREVVTTMWCKCVEGFKRESRQRIIDNLMVGFEKELGSRESCIKNSSAFMSLDLTNRAQISEFVLKMREPYAHKWKHSMEYYFTGKKDASEGQAALMFATMYVDAPSTTNVRSWIESRFMDHVDQLGYEGIKNLMGLYDSLRIVDIQTPMEYTA